MKKFLPIIVLLVAILSYVPSAAAYGGGGGFPPGYYDNPHPKHKLVCEFVKKQLPFNREITVPRCKVVKVAVVSTNNKNTKNKNIKERINDFVTRVKTGGK